MANTTVSFSCDTERDKDLLAWLADLAKTHANKSEAIREAIRAGRLTSTWTLGDVMAELSEIKLMMRRGVVVSQESETGDLEQGEDCQAAQSVLDGLGL